MSGSSLIQLSVPLPKVKEGLLQRRKTLLEQQEQINTVAPRDRTEESDRSDMANGSQERGKAVALSESTQKGLECIERALSKVEEGTYGLCDGCGNQIPPERLEVIPQACHCVNCKPKGRH